MHTGRMSWQLSPGGEVRRKRFHLVGEAESGQVTSLVEYLPGARFPGHLHPEGEEILVLQGVFSDETGDYGPGTHLLNPERFRHSPFSEQGCLIFVKLRQYPGTHHIRTPPGQPVDSPSGDESIAIEPIDAPVELDCPGGLEVFVVLGEATINDSRFAQYDWGRWPCQSRISIDPGPDGVTLYMRRNGVARLRSVA